MADHSKPQTTSTYANFVSELDARLDDLSQGLDPAVVSTAYGSTLAAGSIRWRSANSNWEKYNGTAWSALASAYAININGTVGATTPAAGSFTTLTASSAASFGASSTVGGADIVTVSATQTLTNKTLTTPTIASIQNTGTLTLPTSTDTLVGRATTDTLTNKTLTTPKIASNGTIIDSVNSVAYLRFVANATSATSANQLSIANAIGGSAPSITAYGTDTNVNLNLIPKGTGVVQANGVEVVTLSGTQTLTNKTLTTPTIASIQNTGTLTLPTSTDTLVGRATTDTLTNKILSAPKIASGDGIFDTAGTPVAMLEFTTVASAVNNLNITNAAASGKPTLSAVGTDTNITLNLVSKGTGTVQANAVDIATVSGTQTLTNKSLGDSTTFFTDETDNTKKLQFQLSGIGASTTVTLTPPTASDTIVGATATQTLTNKTLSTGSSWAGNTIGVAYGGLGTSTAPAQFGVLYAASTSAYTNTVAGSTGQIFAGNTSAAPSWQTFDQAVHAQDIPAKKLVVAATTGNLEASTFSASVLTGYTNSLSLSVSTTISSNVATTTSTAGIKVGASITGNSANITDGTTVASIIDATSFTLSAVALATSTSVATTFTQTIAALAVDGVAVAANDRILVKDQSQLGGLATTTSPLANGIYVVTATGGTTAPWVLTRAADANTSAKIANSMVYVARGTLNGGKTFSTTFLSTNTLNTTAMYWDRVLDVNGSYAIGLPTTARGIDIDIEPKIVRLNTGAVTDLAINSFGVKTIESLAASSYSRAHTVYIAGAPSASTNASIAAAYALYVAAGNTLLAGNLTVSGGTISAGNVATTLLGGNTTTNISIGNGLTTGTFTLGAAGSTGAVSLFPATGSQAITLGGATTGTLQLGSTLATAVQLPTGKTKIGQTFLLQGVAGNITLPSTAGTLIGSGDSGTVSNTMLANSSLTIGSTSVSLGGTVTTIAGLSSVTSTGFTGALTGAASSNVLKAGDTMTGMLITRSTTGAIAVADQGTAGIDVRASGAAGDAAYITFHRPSLYAVRFGLDTDNVLKVGGWSAGANAYKLWHEGNDGSGSGLDADTVDGLEVHTGTNNVANRIVRTDGNGYIQAGWINTISGDNGTTAPDRIYASSDAYIRYYTPTNFRTVLNVPTRTGGDASGTWGISVTGNAATASSAVRITFADGPRDLSDRLPSSFARTVNFDFVTAGVANGTGSYGGVMTFAPWLGTTASTGDSSYQLAFGNLSGSNASGQPKLSIRNGIDSTWNAWYTLLHSGNYNSYSPTLTGTGASGTWGISITGSAGTAGTATNLSGGSVSGTTVEGTSLGVNNTTSTNGKGISLYNGATTGQPTYGLMFQGTATFGTHGSVTADWATYFTMDNTANRGWIFRNITSGNIASINNSGTAVFNGNVTAYSDIRLKRDVQVIENAVNKVQQLRGVIYTRIDNQDIGRQTGVIAQEVLKVLPEAVLGSEDSTYSVAYGNMVGLLIEAIKEQQQQIDQLKQLVAKVVEG